MNIKIRQIYSAFGNRLIGSDYMKEMVCATLSFMPEEIIRKITLSCWFMASFEDAYAFTFTGNDLKDMHLIFLSDDLLNQNDTQIYYTIAHEIGHIILGHKNSVVSRQSKEEIIRQEKEADRFAKKNLRFI